jgi:uncharacterized coiled-coil protein SlyX
MVKFLENKQMLHIITEVIVITGITLYFSNKNKKLTSHIEDLSQRIEDLEENLQKQETLINTLIDRLKKQENSLKNTQKMMTTAPKVFSSSKNNTVIQHPQSPSTPKMLLRTNLSSIQPPSVDYKLYTDTSRIEEVKEELSEEALDKQLASELADLADLMETEDTVNEEANVLTTILEENETVEEIMEAEPYDEEETKSNLKKKN